MTELIATARPAPTSSHAPCAASTATLTSDEYERRLAAKDKIIAVLKRRLMQESVHNSSTPFAVLEQNLSLAKVIARKTEELEKERAALEQALIELRETQSQLLHAQKMESIGQLAAGIAHEINTPTQYVMDNVEFGSMATEALFNVFDKALAVAETHRNACPEAACLAEFDSALKRSKLDYLRKQLPEALRQSSEGLTHIASIVSAMKEFSHPSRGEKESVDIRDVVNTTATVARNEWKYVAELETEFAGDLPRVPCLRDLIGQALLNLIVNAAHAIGDTLKPGIREKGRIRISAGRAGDALEIRVSDDGTGIPATIRDRIFDPFFTTKPVGKGTGQGLSIAYSTVVNKHGGEILCESEEGVGTTFVLRLPLSAEQES